jgi:hypothetical protein
MATRFYHGTSGNGAPSVSPSFGTWDDTASAVRRKLFLGTPPSTGGEEGAAAETSATPVNVLLFQFVSEPLNSRASASDTISWVHLCRESSGNLNGFLRVLIRKCDGDGTNDSTIATAVDGTEFATSNISRYDTNSPTFSIGQGQRLVIEVGFYANNTMTNSYIGRVTAYNTGAADLDANDSDTDPVDNSWIEFADTYTEATGGTDYPWPPDATGYGTDEEVIPSAEFASSRNRVGSAVCAAAVAAAIAFSPVPSTGAAVTISAGADFENATVITADVAGTLSADHELEVAVYPDAGATEVVSAGADLRVAVVTEGDVTGSFEVSEQGTYEADVSGAGTGYGINGEISTGAEVGGSLVAPADVAVTISTGAELGVSFVSPADVAGTISVGSDFENATEITADVAGTLSADHDLEVAVYPDAGVTEVVSAGADLSIIQNKEYEGDVIGYIDVGEGTYTASVDAGEGEDNDLRFIIWYRSDRQ